MNDSVFEKYRDKQIFGVPFSEFVKLAIKIGFFVGIFGGSVAAYIIFS